jgi:hypothetical protein
MFEKIISRLEEQEMYSLSIAVYGLYILYQQIKARNATLQSNTITKIFYRTLYDIKQICNCTNVPGQIHSIMRHRILRPIASLTMEILPSESQKLLYKFVGALSQNWVTPKFPL